MKSTDIKEATDKLLEMSAVIKQLDESMREAALRILTPLYFPDHAVPSKTLPKNNSSLGESASLASDTSDIGEFIESFEQGKPADNVLLLVAWLYSRHGAYPITAKELQELGASSGLVLSNRPDNVMRSAKNEGKSLFTQQGKGWRLTVSGELYVRGKYNVKKGNGTRSPE